MLLAGDIGGTKTVLALFDVANIWHPLYLQSFPSGDYHSLEAIIEEFLADKTVTVTHASFGVAGPVLNNKASITNLPWLIDGTAVAQQFRFEQAHLLNDLEAIATAVPHLRSADLVVLNHGEPDPQGTIGVIAPGTGLGEAFISWDGERYQAHPSEGGHASFAPANKEQTELLSFLWGRFNHVSYERVCSGSGIPNLYDYLQQCGRFDEPAWLKDELATTEDRSPVIFNNALEKEEPICVAALQLFIDILANEASNLAIKLLATGGIYIGGGIPPRILPQFKSMGFVQSYTSKGRFADLVRKMPVYVIRNTQTGLFGAAIDSQEMFKA